VELRISADSDDGKALSSLHRWFNEDRAVSGAVDLSAVGNPERGAQSAEFDFILAVTNTVTGVASLAVSYAAWRDAHRRKEVVTFEGDGRTVRALDGSAATTQSSIEAFPDPHPPAPEPSANQEP
jgi:membrane-associated two-gene conflict system component 1 (EACC1)